MGKKKSKKGVDTGIRITDLLCCTTEMNTSFPDGSAVKNPSSMQETCRFQLPWIGKLPWTRKWQPTPVLSPRKNAIDREVWQGTVHGVTKSQSQLDN